VEQGLLFYIYGREKNGNPSLPFTPLRPLREMELIANADIILENE
jgi:hypothetical protein